MFGSFYGERAPGWPADPFAFLVWWQCGYPPSEERCPKGRPASSSGHFRESARRGPTASLLFDGLAPAAAVPSNSPYVAVRIESGREPAKYPATYAARSRA